MDPILPVGEFSTDNDIGVQLHRAGYRAQLPDARWNAADIETGIRGYMARAGINASGRPERTDIVFVSPDGSNAVVMSTFVESGQRIYFGLAPTQESERSRGDDREAITVWGRRERDRDGVSVAEQWARNYVQGDMGENPSRAADIPLPGLGNGANLTFENEGITLRIPSWDGTDNQRFEHVPDDFDFSETLGGLQQRTRERQEELAEQRRLGRRDD